VHQVAAEAHWQVTFSATPETMRVPDVVEITAFRITQEALTNVRKHAQASWVSVMLALQNGFLSIEIRDGGCGFDPESVPGQPRRVGLTSMRERARLVGGELTIDSSPGAGTTVGVLLPVSHPVEQVSISSSAEEVQ
jgi:signal transduction histidine kinase